MSLSGDFAGNAQDGLFLYQNGFSCKNAGIIW